MHALFTNFCLKKENLSRKGGNLSPWTTNLHVLNSNLDLDLQA